MSERRHLSGSGHPGPKKEGLRPGLPQSPEKTTSLDLAKTASRHLEEHKAVPDHEAPKTEWYPWISPRSMYQGKGERVEQGELKQASKSADTSSLDHLRNARSDLLKKLDYWQKQSLERQEQKVKRDTNDGEGKR